MSNRLSFREKLTHYLNASYPMLWVQTHEEVRVVNDIADHFVSPPEGRKPRDVFEWDAVRGLTKYEVNKSRTPLNDTIAIKKVLDFIDKTSGSYQLFILKDFHPYFQEPVVRRALRNMLGRLKNKANAIVFVSATCNIPEELIKEIQLMEFSLPDENALKARLEFVQRAVVSSRTASGEDATEFTITPEISMKAVEASKGLTDGEAENAFTLALVENKKFNDGFVNTVFGEKVMQVKKNGLLTYLEPDVSFEQVGGLDGLKSWIRQRSLAYSASARAYGLPFPRGMMLCGIPGCGKTLLAKATSAELKLPLFQLDVGSLFSKMVGDTEQNFRRVLQIVDGIGSCILFID